MISAGGAAERSFCRTSRALLEGILLRLRDVLPGYVEADSGDSLLHKYIAFVDLPMFISVVYRMGGRDADRANLRVAYLGCEIDLRYFDAP